MFLCRVVSTVLVVAALAVALVSRPAFSQEIVVLGSMDQTIDWLKARNWWGEESRDTVTADVKLPQNCRSKFPHP